VTVPYTATGLELGVFSMHNDGAGYGFLGSTGSFTLK
jgi:hypothetical protein